jgi:large subunit ribosomal protein L23
LANIKTIIKRPCITEKGSVLRDRNNQYTFEVDAQANRLEIKRAIEKKFKVTVLSVNTITVHGKRKRSVGRFLNKNKMADWKKALVKLKTGDKIDIIEGV